MRLDTKYFNDMKTVKDNTPESIFRSYHQYNVLKTMIKRKDSIETMTDVIDMFDEIKAQEKGITLQQLR